MTTASKPLNEHPIQLEEIQVDHLYFFRHPDFTPELVETIRPVLQFYDPDIEDPAEFTYTVRAVYAFPGLDMDDAEPDFTGKPFSLLVQLTGVFRSLYGVTVEDCEKFYEEEALAVLYPFLREQVHDLTVRGCGVGIMLPLLQK